MMNEKFFLRSRALWGAAIPLAIAAVGLYGVATDGMEQQLGDIGDQLALLAAAGLSLWSRFAPDAKKLTAVPNAK